MTSTLTEYASPFRAEHIHNATFSACHTAYLSGFEAIHPTHFLQALLSDPSKESETPVLFPGELAASSEPCANPLLDVLARCAKPLRSVNAAYAVREQTLAPQLLIGQGLGAMLAAELACLTATPYTTLVLIAPLGLWLDDHPIPNLFTLDAASATQRLWHNPQHPHARHMQAHWPPPGLHALTRIAWPFAEHGLRERLPHLEPRVLIIAGEQDRVTPVAYAHAFSKLLPLATVKIIADCGHLPTLERPLETATAIHDFMNMRPTSASHATQQNS